MPTPNDAIAAYKEAQIAFDAVTTKTQESLEACGWQWVKRSISGYHEADDDDYQYMLVCPTMYEALDLEFGDDTPTFVEEPNYIHWHEFIDYTLF
jgi:allophanate hydrolase subunit 1